MAGQSWGRFKEELEGEIEKARRRMLLAKSLDEMEEIALAVGNVLHEKVIAAGVAEREGQPAGRCPECDGQLKKKGKKERQIKTSRGAVKIERERYECLDCGASLFPPGQTVTD